MISLPLLYHLHHSLHMEDLPFWQDLARRSGGPILELGCGTGRLLVPLAEAGFPAFGLDRDRPSLAFLHSRLRPPDFAGPGVFLGDMAAFHLARRFGLITLPCNTLSTLSAQDRRATLACACRHLRPGGLFAASLPNPAVLKRLPRTGESEVEEAFFIPGSGDPVQVSSAWERTRAGFGLWWFYDCLLPDGRVERQVIETRHSLAPVSEIESDLASTGLKIVERYGDFDRSPFLLNSPSWIVVAQRQP